MKIQCPSCDQRLEIPEELAGQTIECPACNASLVVPSLATPPPSPVQVQQSAPQVTASEKPKSSVLKWAAPVAIIMVVAVGMFVFYSNTKVKTDGESKISTPAPERKPDADAAKSEPPTVKAPDISIHEAAKTGNIEAVQAHLAAGTNINAKDGGFTPLHLAIGNKEIVQLLITKGADVNARSVVGWTPLQYATGDNKKDVVELLIAEGADVNAKGGIGGGTSLYLAAMSGHKELVELLIAADADVNVRESQLGMTPLDMADDKGTADLLRKHGGKTGEELKAEGK